MLISHFNLQYQLVKVEGCSYISMCIKKQVKLQYTVPGLKRYNRLQYVSDWEYLPPGIPHLDPEVRTHNILSGRLNSGPQDHSLLFSTFKNIYPTDYPGFTSDFIP